MRIVFFSILLLTFEVQNIYSQGLRLDFAGPGALTNTGFGCSEREYLHMDRAILRDNGCWFSTCEQDEVIYVGKQCNGKQLCTVQAKGDWTSKHNLFVDYTCIKSMTTFQDVAYFNSHLTDHNNKYCAAKKIHQRSIDDVTNAISLSLFALLVSRRSAPDHRVTRPGWNQETVAIREYGEIRNGNNYYPSYVIADIRFGHLFHFNSPNYQRPPAPPALYTFLNNNMGFIRGIDELGHLLAASLGGPSDQTYNSIPQTRMMNRGRGSLWYNFEQRISTFLNEDAEHNSVEWRVAVIYGQGLSRRPIGLCFQFRELTAGQDMFTSDEICFSNDSRDRECVFEPNPHMSY